MSTITVGSETVDADELHARAGDLAERLTGAAAVAIVAHPALDTIVTVLAALQAEVPAIPMSPDAGPRERAHVLEDSGATVLFDNGTLADLPPAHDEPPAGDLILYTSGTTGPPKGVPISRVAVRACIEGLADAWSWSPDDTLVHGLPLHHVHGLVLGVLGPLQIGSALHHTVRPTPQAYAAARGSLYFGVPTVWNRVAADASAAQAMRHARLLVSGSAALPAPVFDSLLAQSGQAPVERYGMTETLITLAATADTPRIRGTVGTALPGVRVRIVDDEDAPVSQGAIGALQVAGPSVFAGYLHRPDATAGAFTADGWFRTGDVASIGDDGRFRIVGRASTDLIKTGGYRVGAGEVEDALLAHPAVREAAVIGIPDDDLGQRIVAYVVADGASAQQLVDFVSSTLAGHKRPREVRLVDSLPRNAMGKVDKVRLND